MDDHYFSLKEIFRLESEILNKKKEIENQIQRVKKLVKEKECKTEQINTLTKKIDENEKLYKSKEKELESIESRIQNFSLQSSSVKNLQAFQQAEIEIKQLNLDKTTREDLLFALIDENDKLKNEEEDSKIFIKGITETIEEIDKEVQEEVFHHNKTIEQCQLRIANILENLPSSIKDFYQQFRKINPGSALVAKTKDNECSECHMSLSRQLISDVDRKEKFHFCPYCQRILLPFGL